MGISSWWHRTKRKVIGFFNRVHNPNYPTRWYHKLVRGFVFVGSLAWSSFKVCTGISALTSMYESAIKISGDDPKERRRHLLRVAMGVLGVGALLALWFFPPAGALASILATHLPTVGTLFTSTTAISVSPAMVEVGIGLCGFQLGWYGTKQASRTYNRVKYGTAYPDENQCSIKDASPSLWQKLKSDLEHWLDKRRISFLRLSIPWRSGLKRLRDIFSTAKQGDYLLARQYYERKLERVQRKLYGDARRLEGFEHCISRLQQEAGPPKNLYELTLCSFVSSASNVRAREVLLDPAEISLKDLQQAYYNARQKCHSSKEKQIVKAEYRRYKAEYFNSMVLQLNQQCPTATPGINVSMRTTRAYSMGC